MTTELPPELADWDDALDATRAELVLALGAAGRALGHAEQLVDQLVTLADGELEGRDGRDLAAYLADANRDIRAANRITARFVSPVATPNPGVADPAG